MQITNSLEEKSFAYSAEKETMDARRDEIGRLMEIVSYCQEDEVGEPVRYHDTLWEICVQEGVTFTGWLFNREGAGSADDRRRLLDALSKNVMIPMDETRKRMSGRAERSFPGFGMLQNTRRLCIPVLLTAALQKGCSLR